jgi:hypothetical protein
MHRNPMLLPFLAVHAERREAARSPLDLPIRLRLGGDLFPGTTRDLSAVGLGLQVGHPPYLAGALDRTLAEHERGAVELFLADMHRTARVRMVRIQPARDGLRVGATFAYCEEAEALIRWLRHYGLLAILPDAP